MERIEVLVEGDPGENGKIPRYKTTLRTDLIESYQERLNGVTVTMESGDKHHVPDATYTQFSEALGKVGIKSLLRHP